jgi:hypothetical protein
MAECAFCGTIVRGKLSEEHVWPDWLIRELPPTEGLTRERMMVTASPTAELIADRSRSEGPEAAPSKVRAVCRDECNGGWMSDMEAEIKPILLPIARGLTGTITADEQRRISLWAIKTTMILEYTDNQTRVTTPEQRRQLYESRNVGQHPGRIPKTFEVWMGAHTGDGITSRWYMHRTGLIVDRQRDNRAYDRTVLHEHNMHYTFLVIGKVVLVVFGHAMPRVARVQTSFGIDRRANRGLSKIHNATTDLRWSPKHVATWEDLHQMAIAVVLLCKPHFY